VIGRNRELETLGEVFSRAAEGHGGMVLLAGEAGVGKTRLAEEAVARGALACLRGAAVEQGTSPYAPVVASLRWFLRRDPAGLAPSHPLVAHLGVLLPELGAAPEVTDRETLIEAVRTAFQTIATRKPTVVLLDDLHWADAATLELLPSLAEAAEEWPLLVLGAYRTEEIPRGHPLRRLRTDLRRAGRLAELAVEPLDPEEASRLAARVLDGEPGPSLGAALYDRSQGVPFLVEELAAALRDGGRLAAGPNGLELDEGSTVPLPETLRDALRVRTDGLSDAARATLEAAAVAGSEVELELLTELGRDAALGEVLDRGLLREVELGIAAFRHDLVREAVYADTHWPRRRALHREVATLLEGRGADPRLTADHWLAAGERARALPLLVETARRFCRIHAYRDAAAAARTALELWPEGEDEAARLEVLDQLGQCAQLCGELAEAGRVWEEVAASLDDRTSPERVAEVRRRLATVYELEGASVRAGAARLEAGDALERAGLGGEAATEWLLAVELAWTETPNAESVLARAAEAARSAGRTDVESRCLSVQGFMTGRAGRHEEGLALMRSALTLALDGNHVDAAVDAYWALGATANDWGDYAAARSVFDEAVVYCRTNELEEGESFCLGCLVVVLGNGGDWARAEELARDLLERPALPEVSRLHALVTIGMIAASQGVTKRARRLLSRAHALASALEAEQSEHESLVGLALVDELDGVESLHWPELVAHPIGRACSSRPRGLRLAATFAARRGDTALLYACADATASWASRFGSTEALAALAHVLGEVALLEGNTSTAADQLGLALERLGEVDAPFERALTQARAGVALLAAGERELGVERLAGAYQTFRKLGARPFANRAAADLEAAGERVDRRLGRRAARDLRQGGLTRRELEILRLVAVGRTNREIAHQLFLSPRTVDMHVRNLLAKLGCRSRTEATGRAYEIGLLEAMVSHASPAGTEGEIPG
jgi:DNA-binding CsgD family transcriptional regulator